METQTTERIAIPLEDGKLAVHGTGSEDFFNGGWYNVPGRWNGRISLPVSGALGYNVPLARTGGYRFFVTDAYAFRQSIRQTIDLGNIKTAPG